MSHKSKKILFDPYIERSQNVKISRVSGLLSVVLFFTLVVGPDILTAQSENAPTSLLSTEAPTLRFEHLKVGDGLAQGSANFITQDNQGYIWISTQSGLHRYDGYEFKVYEYTAFDSTSLSEGWVWQVDEAENGDLWVATNSSGLNRMDRATGTFKHYMHNPDDSTTISSNWTRFVYEDSSGDLWVTTENDGLNRMQADNDGHFQHFRHVHEDSSTITSNNLFFIDEDPEGNIWIGSVNGLNRINPETDEITRFLFDPDAPERYGEPSNVLGMHHSPDEPGIHWVSTGNGLLRFDSNTGEYERFLIEPNDADNVNPLNLIHEVVPDPNLEGVFWVTGPGTGVARFDVRTEEFTTYRHDPRDPNSLAEDYSQSIYADRSGTIWVGYTAEGVSTFNPGAVNFSHLRHDPEDSESLAPGIVWGIYEDQNETLWIGTDAGPSTRYLTQYNPERRIVKYHQFDPDNANTLLPGLYWRFAEDENGGFWVAGNVGLSRLDRETGTVTRFQQDEGRNNNIFDMQPTLSDANKLWLANVGGLDLFDTETGTFTKINVAPEGWEFEPIVLEIYEDVENQLIWLGTADGLVRYDIMTKSSEIFSYNPSDTTSISDDVIFGVVPQNSDPTILWIATQSSGLNRFDTKTNTATHFTKEDGLADNHIYGLLTDENGTLWMSSNGGITNFDPETFAIRNYGLDDGLIALEYNQNAYFKSKSGALYFGSSKGVTAFVPGQLKINENPPQVAIADFKIFNKSLEIGPNSPLQDALSKTERITLRHNQNEITIDYAALHYSNSNRNQYQYQLQGYDQDWVDANTDRSATYTNLSPGDYTFKVKAANSDGVWNEQGASIGLSILPPWYQTWWAYLLFAGMLGLSVFGVDRFQRKRLSIKEQERAALREAELRAEAENKRRSDTEQLSKIGQTITSTLSVDKIIETVYENVNALMDAAIFGVGIYNGHNKRLEFPATKEKGEMLPPYSYNLDEESRIAVWCFKNKKEIIIGDFANEYTKYVEEYKQPVEGEFSDSVIYLPLIQQGNVIGVITTQSFKKNAYTEYHINLLRNLATYAAIALDNASAYRQLNATLSELKTTQNQLVQQEKLASLGQLTAGIAHEIKNPLNFVNNFSDLSIELVEEARDEVNEKLTADSHQLIAILGDIESNLKKIYEHGSRADSIVKSMLLHSRGGSGIKEKTDLNALIKEYVNLAFHGMRAGKDPINVDINLELDDEIKTLPLITEDFSRVLLNLCNNAFDAMREKLSSRQLSDNTPQKYEPKLTVRTRHKGSTITIEIEDNGPGIPVEMKDKVLQPFFTTKKGTEGTGLGLSITNDIIKAHGGALDILTKKDGTIMAVTLNNS
ncbi:MAG: GAF domain-containing protein [Bacteroidetes bacterium]|jgi:signal transduction histidine kinase/ligand-binding sensor domain-containing protein|nr:GAF domain-containing protein [Bacteroidota bacterium]